MFAALKTVTVAKATVAQLSHIVYKRSVILRTRPLVIIHDPVGWVVEGGQYSRNYPYRPTNAIQSQHHRIVSDRVDTGKVNHNLSHNH